MLSIQELSFFQTYSLPTIVISVLVAVIMFFIVKFFSDKLPSTIIIYLPFILGILFNAVYVAIFIGFDGQLTDLVSAGIVCGWLSQIIVAFIKRVINGNITELNFINLAIEEILSNHINKQTLSICVISIKSEIIKSLNAKVEPEDIINNVMNIIKDNSTICDNTKLYNLASLTVNAVKNLILK